MNSILIAGFMDELEKLAAGPARVPHLDYDLVKELGKAIGFKGPSAFFIPPNDFGPGRLYNTLAQAPSLSGLTPEVLEQAKKSGFLVAPDKATMAALYRDAGKSRHSSLATAEIASPLARRHELIHYMQSRRGALPKTYNTVGDAWKMWKAEMGAYIGMQRALDKTIRDFNKYESLQLISPKQARLARAGLRLQKGIGYTTSPIGATRSVMGVLRGEHGTLRKALRKMLLRR